MGQTETLNKFWPRLGSLPSTNALIVTVIVLWLATGGAALFGKPADRWYQALETFTGIVVVQFAAKRWTNGRGVNGNDRTQSGNADVPAA